MTLVVLYVENISVVILIRTDTTLDHSQKAEKVCRNISPSATQAFVQNNAGILKTIRILNGSFPTFRITLFFVINLVVLVRFVEFWTILTSSLFPVDMLPRSCLQKPGSRSSLVVLASNEKNAPRVST